MDLQSMQTQISSKGKLLYSSIGTVTVGNNSDSRSSMLPPPMADTTLTVPANGLPIGASLMMIGRGVISARTTMPGSFTFTPTVTPAGGSKTDLGGLTVTPLIGVAAYCELWLTYTQTPTGLQTSGVVKYGVDNGQHYSVIINPTNIIVPSDPSVARTFGADGQWSVASSMNYVTPNAVTITYMPNGN